MLLCFKLQKKQFQQGRLFWGSLRYQKVSAQDIHHTTAYVHIGHLLPQQLCPHEAYWDQDFPQ